MISLNSFVSSVLQIQALKLNLTLMFCSLIKHFVSFRALGNGRNCVCNLLSTIFCCNLFLITYFLSLSDFIQRLAKHAFSYKCVVQKSYQNIKCIEHKNSYEGSDQWSI